MRSGLWVGGQGGPEALLRRGHLSKDLEGGKGSNHVSFLGVYFHIEAFCTIDKLKLLSSGITSDLQFTLEPSSFKIY